MVCGHVRVSDGVVMCVWGVLMVWSCVVGC